MEGVTKQEFAAFVSHPTANAYLALVGKIVASPAYDPYGVSLHDVRQLKDQRRYQDAIQRAGEVMPGLLLSPTLHLYLSIAYSELGNQDSSELERHIYFAFLDGILGTGDGSQASPYHVAYVSDEYEVILVFKKKSAGQELIGANGRHYDVQKLTDGTEIWFDITPAKSHMDRLFQMGDGQAETNPQALAGTEAINKLPSQNPPVELTEGGRLENWITLARSWVMRLLHL